MIGSTFAGLFLELLSIMRLSMLRPTYPKSGEGGVMVGGLIPEVDPRGGDFVPAPYSVNT